MGQPIKIYVGNIPQSARNSELKELFEKFGKVVECDILKEFAFVHMDDTNDAKAAIAGLNDSLWKGARIRVELSTTKTSKGEPSMRHRMASDDLARSLRRRSHDRDRRPSPPSSYMRSSRESRSTYDSRYGAPPYSRSTDLRGPIRDSRYGGPPPRSRPYPEAYDRRGYPESRGPMPPRGGYPPEYPFHPSSYRDPIRDHRGPAYPDPYGRPPMGHYGQPIPYYRGPPPMGSGSRYDYPPQGYPSSRPSRYSPPPPSSRDLYRVKDYRGLSPRDSSREQPSFNGHRDRHVSPSKTRSRRHHSSISRSPSPVNKRNGHHTKQDRNASYSRSPSPLPRRNGHHKSANDRSSSRSLSPKGTNGARYLHEDASSSRSPSPVISKTRHSRSRKSKDNGKSKPVAASSGGSESNNSSLNESSSNRRSSKINGHSKDIKKTSRVKRAASSSPSRSRSRSSIRSSGIKA